MLPIWAVWVDPVDLTIQCSPTGNYDEIYLCCDDNYSSSSNSSSSSSSSTSIGVSCCANSFGRTVTAIFHNGSNCAGLNLEEMTLTWNAATSKWEGTKALACGMTWELKFYCLAPAILCSGFRLDWAVTQGACTTTPTGGLNELPDAPACTCNPLVVFFDLTMDTSGCGCCTNGAARVVTIEIVE